MVSEKILYWICDISASYTSIAETNIPNIVEPLMRNIRQPSVWQTGGYRYVLYLSQNGLIRVCVSCI